MKIYRYYRKECSLASPKPHSNLTIPKFNRQIYSNTSDATQTVAIPTIPIIKVSIVWVL